MNRTNALARSLLIRLGIKEKYLLLELINQLYKDEEINLEEKGLLIDYFYGILE